MLLSFRIILSLITASAIFSQDPEEVNHAKGHIPSVFVLGVQKGGSSSLHSFLLLHPLVCGGIHKEPHFFDHDEFFRKGREAYASFFTDVKCENKKNAIYVGQLSNSRMIYSSIF